MKGNKKVEPNRSSVFNELEGFKLANVKCSNNLTLPFTLRNKMRVRSAVRRLCKDCRIVKRRKRIYVTCKRSPRHKQRQGFSTIVQQPKELVPTTTLINFTLPTTTTTIPTTNQAAIQRYGAFQYLSAFR